GNAATTTVLTASPATISLTDKVQLTGTVTSKAGIPTGTLTFLTSDTNLGVVSLTPSGSGSVTTSASALAIGNGTVTAVYSGDAVFAGSAGIATIALKVPDSGALIVPFVT